MNEDRNAEPGTWLELPIMVGVGLSIVMTWPLVLYLGTDIPAEYGDPLLDSWHVIALRRRLVETVRARSTPRARPIR